MQTPTSTSSAHMRAEALDQARTAAAGTGSEQLTAGEYEHYAAELRELVAARETGLVGLLRDARGFVAADATEELAQLQAGQAAADMRIARLQRLLSCCEIVHHDPCREVAVIGCEVDLEFTRTGARKRFALSGVGIGPHGRGGTQQITARSPVGQAVLGCSVGDVVIAELPDGRREELVIIAIALPWAASGPA